MNALPVFPVISLLRYALNPSLNNNQASRAPDTLSFFSKKVKVFEFEDIWHSNIFDESGAVLGYREIQHQGQKITISTKDVSGQISSHEILNLTNESFFWGESYSAVTSKNYHKFHQIIDGNTLEIVINEVDGDIIGYETQTAEPLDTTKSLNWGSLAGHLNWFCILWDDDRNQVGYRKIYSSPNYSYIVSEYEQDKRTLFESLRRLPSNFKNEFGTLENYLKHFRICDIESSIGASNRSIFSKSGIIVGESDNVELHLNLARKFDGKSK